MSQHCQAGDTARVTLSDGRIFSTVNSPVEITQASIYSTAGLRVTVGFVTGYFANGNPRYSSTPTFNSRNDIESAGVVIGSTYNPVPVNFSTSFGNNYSVLYLGESNPVYIATNFGVNPILEARFFISGARIFPVNRIKITDSLGNILLDEQFDGTYSVECLRGCPPNSLDCGDCCLSCDEVTAGLTNIRNLIINL
jgi:hypothetical protein